MVVRNHSQHRCFHVPSHMGTHVHPDIRANTLELGVQNDTHCEQNISNISPFEIFFLTILVKFQTQYETNKNRKKPNCLKANLSAFLGVLRLHMRVDAQTQAHCFVSFHYFD